MRIVSYSMTNALKMMMPTDTPSQSRRLTGEDVKAILKAELRLRDMTYADLIDRLADRGIVETEANLRNKISRGAFTASFFVQCLLAIGCEQVSIRRPT